MKKNINNFNIEMDSKKMEANGHAAFGFKCSGLKVEYSNRGVSSKSETLIHSNKAVIAADEIAISFDAKDNLAGLFKLAMNLKKEGISSLSGIFDKDENSDAYKFAGNADVSVSGKGIAGELSDFGYNRYNLTEDKPEAEKNDWESKFSIDELDISGSLDMVVDTIGTIIASIEDAENEKDPNKEIENEKDPNKETDIDQFVEELKKKNPAMSKEELVGAVISVGYDRKTAEAIL